MNKYFRGSHTTLDRFEILRYNHANRIEEGDDLVPTRAGFETFLSEFVPEVARLSNQVREASWELATTGSEEAATRQADLVYRLRVLFSDRTTYERLVAWQESGEIENPLLTRQLDVLINDFKGNMLPSAILAEISQGETELEKIYSTFRPEFEGQLATENDIKDVLTAETSVERRLAAWNASKEIGLAMAPGIRELVALRNEGARALGYSDFWRMSMELQEIDPDWLLPMFEKLAEASDPAYQRLLQEINGALARRFNVDEEELGPWAWGEPFCQEDPLDVAELNRLVAETGIDIVEVGTRFYDSLGFNVHEVIARSDLYEREGKNQHGFCEDFDRKGDVRFLVNLRPTMRWLQTFLHELGHAVHFLGFDRDLPWLLRDTSIITAEAMAILVGGQIFRPEFLRALVTDGDENFEPLVIEAGASYRRWNLIASRWVLVMVNFEAQMYANPDQDLNRLWWSLVEKYQGIRPPEGREGKEDWAAKMHIALAPAYYQGYLLGEFFAAMLQDEINRITGFEGMYGHPAVGSALSEMLFSPGDRMSWDSLIVHVLGEELSPEAWLREYGS